MSERETEDVYQFIDDDSKYPQIIDVDNTIHGGRSSNNDDLFDLIKSTKPPKHPKLRSIRNTQLNKKKFTQTQIDLPIQLSLKYHDMKSLQGNNYLNDNIIQSYLQIFRQYFLSKERKNQCYFYSTHFMTKVIGQYLKDKKSIEKLNKSSIKDIKLLIKKNFQNVKKWTRKQDIFNKEILVLPINGLTHWFCIIMLRPYALLEENVSQQFEILYCDSMFTRQQSIVTSIRKYLQLQLKEKRGVDLQITEANAPCYQLLLPRQTNTHDCGLYMLAYIQQLIKNRKQVKNLSAIKNRNKLSLFPKVLISSMRQRLTYLFSNLLIAQKPRQKNFALTVFTQQKEKLIKNAQKSEFDVIDVAKFQKYLKRYYENPSSFSPQQLFISQIRFYLTNPK